MQDEVQQKKDLHFHMLYSDLDLGIEIDDTTTDQDIQKMKRLYYRIKFFIFFLGELEIYKTSELAALRELLAINPGLYDKVRDFRKINWIKGKLKSPGRNIYHRIKDHRTLNILKRRYLLSSFHNCVFKTYDDLLPITTLSTQTITFPKAPDLPNNFVCDYLSQKICWSIRPEQRIRQIMVLASVPPISRSNWELDTFLTLIRNENPSLKKIFDTLNGIEFLIAQAFIRGSEKPEEWHDRWMKNLIKGAAKAAKNSPAYL